VGIRTRQRAERAVRREQRRGTTTDVRIDRLIFVAPRSVEDDLDLLLVRRRAGRCRRLRRQPAERGGRYADQTWSMTSFPTGVNGKDPPFCKFDPGCPTTSVGVPGLRTMSDGGLLRPRLSTSLLSALLSTAVTAWHWSRLPHCQWRSRAPMVTCRLVTCTGRWAATSGSPLSPANHSCIWHGSGTGSGLPLCLQASAPARCGADPRAAYSSSGRSGPRVFARRRTTEVDPGWQGAACVDRCGPSIGSRAKVARV